MKDEICKQSTGLFGLSSCGRPADAYCQGCGHAVCHDHSQLISPYILCPECAKNRDLPGLQRPSSLRDINETPTDPYFSDQRYYGGHSSASYYSESDRQIFSAEANSQTAETNSSSSSESFETNFDGS